MLLHVCLLLEPLAAGGAGVRPLPRVDAAVRFQVILGGKLFAALGAAVGRLAPQHHLRPHLRGSNRLLLLQREKRGGETGRRAVTEVEKHASVLDYEPSVECNC